MRYLFVFLTIIVIWVAILIMAAQGNQSLHFAMYLLALISTLALYLIGFRRAGS